MVDDSCCEIKARKGGCPAKCVVLVEGMCTGSDRDVHRFFNDTIERAELEMTREEFGQVLIFMTKRFVDRGALESKGEQVVKDVSFSTWWARFRDFLQKG